ERYDDAHDGPATGRVDGLESVIFAVQLLQPRSPVGQADARAVAGERMIGAKAGAGIAHLEKEPAVRGECTDLDEAGARPLRDAVADGVLDERLEQQRWDLRIERLRRRIDRHLEPVAEADLLDLEVRLQEGEVLLERHYLLR